MGALAHYLEAKGIPTTQISLIAKHTEIIKPPRALWVPFELGRPLGAPNQPEFQKKVALAALKLLEAEQGPVLESFPEEAPEVAPAESEEAAIWSCPVSFAPQQAEMSDHEQLVANLQQEVTELRPWYDLGLEKRGRTAMATFEPQTAANLLAEYLTNGSDHSSNMEFSPGVALRLAAQDIKAYYFEAVTSRPGAQTPDSKTFSNWFWNETAAGKTLQTVKEK
ncbi:MAG: hypothetical protein R6U55_02170 [Desulfovermiculus sp.]